MKNSVCTTEERDFIDSCVFSTHQFSPPWCIIYQGRLPLFYSDTNNKQSRRKSLNPCVESNGEGKRGGGGKMARVNLKNPRVQNFFQVK